MVIIINIRRFLSIATAIALTIGANAQLVAHGESFEQPTEDTLAPPITMSDTEASETEAYQQPQDEPQTEAPAEEPAYNEPSYDDAQQEQPQVEETTPEETTTEETTTYVQEAAFYYTVEDGEAILQNCRTPALNKIDVPEIIDGYPVTTILENTFSECYNAIEINLPYSIKSIDDGAFKMCNNLQYIGVATENKHYKSVNGVLYNFDGSSIIAYPANRADESYTIAEGVSYICNSCFNNCANLESLKLPPTLQNIGYSAFNGCIALKELTVNNNVELSTTMFTNCNLETIYGYQNSHAEDYAYTYGIAFESIGILETEITSASTEETAETVTTTEETQAPSETVTGASITYYAPESSGTDMNEKIVIVIIVVALVSFVIAVASRSRRNEDDDDDDDDEDDEYEDDDEDEDEDEDDE